MTVKFHIIKPQAKISFGLRDVFKSRELLWMFVQRQISTRYRQMVFGVLWAMLEPLAQLIMLTLVFGFLLKVETGGHPYPLFAFAGLIAWWLFSRNLMAVAACLQDNLGLISKVYFPRLILAFAASFREIIDSLIIVLLLLTVVFFYGYKLDFKVIVLLPLLLFTAFLSLGIGLWAASIMVRFRDTRPMLGLILQAGMYASPVLYSSALVPDWLQFYYQLNPMYWVIEFSRWGLLDKVVVITPSFYWSILFSIGVMLGGLLVFSATEKLVVDV